MITDIAYDKRTCMGLTVHKRVTASLRAGAKRHVFAVTVCRRLRDVTAAPVAAERIATVSKQFTCMTSCIVYKYAR